MRISCFIWQFFFSPDDFNSVQRTIKQFEEITQSLAVQDNQSGITAELSAQIKKAEVLVRRLSKQWSVSRRSKSKLK